MTEKLTNEKTYVACLTPAGSGAIASLGLRGPRAWEVVRELFQQRKGSSQHLPAEPQVGPIWLGCLGEETADEVVISVRSVDPAPWVEVGCHGGREVVRLVMATFEKRGIQTCRWEELEAVESGDPLQAAAMLELSRTSTVRTAAILLDQAQGAFRRAIEGMIDAMEAGEASDVEEQLASLLRRIPLGRHLTTPWRVVVAGAPNVGKSSLVNALIGYQRCVVSPTPGTTRDVVTSTIAIDGWPIELMDTAGMRQGETLLEEAGIGLALEALQSADLCLWLLDASAPPVLPDYRTQAIHLVINKVDLPSTWDLSTVPAPIPVSAKTGQGLAELCASVSSWLVPEPPPAGAALPFTPTLCDQVEQAWKHYCAGRAEDGKLALKQTLEDFHHGTHT